MQFKIWSLALAACTLSLACQEAERPAPQPGNVQAAHQGVVQEVLEATAYTYLKVEEAGAEYWMAVTKRPVEIGQTVYYDRGLEMTNFESRDLGRTFDKVYFVQDLKQASMPSGNGATPGSPHGKRPEIPRLQVAVEQPPGAVSIAGLFAARDNYANKTVRVKGKVVKVNSSIMGRNWIHLQDGTNDSGNYDLTVTTNETVAVGDVVALEGKIALKKDFGSGYSYELIMEEARVLAD